MAMRNPYAAYKQQARISENKKALKNLQEQKLSLESSEVDVQQPEQKVAVLGNTQATEETEKTSPTTLDMAASTALVDVVPSNISKLAEPKDIKVIQKENPYLYNTIMTASSADLVSLLYGGAIKFMKQAISYMKDNKASEANHVNQRAQAIFEELMCTLDMEGQPEMSQQLYTMYEFINYSLVEANIKKNPEQIEKMIEFTNDLRMTWQEAIKSAKNKKAAK